MSHRTKQETTIDAMVGYDVEFHCPNVTQLVDDVKQHDVGDAMTATPMTEVLSNSILLVYPS